MKHAALALVALAALAGTAAAQAPGAPAPDDDVAYEYAGQMLSRRDFLYVDVPGMMPPPGVSAAPPSRVLYVNDCKPAGCTIQPGNFTLSDDSRINRSSIVRGTSPRTLAAYTGSASSWNAIIACVRENYAPYGIEVVTTEPPVSTSYFEAFAAGRPEQLGFSTQSAGVASLNCGGPIPNAISFSFLNLSPGDVLGNCWTISQESAHNFGLSHSMLGTDAMTYILSPARKRFVNQTACVGTQGCCLPADECRCPGVTEQNSHTKLLSIFGPAGATPPTITIDEPVNNAAVDPGFTVRATVTDDVGVARVELLIDDVAIASLTTPPFTFTTPTDLATGPHRVGIRATDATTADATVSIMVNVGDPCTGDGECAAAGEGYVCVDGRCVPGAGVPGGLGAHCDSPADCLSDFCITRNGENFCSEHCTPGGAGCSEGFQCNDLPDGTGACVPGVEGTCLGCSSDGQGGATPIAPIGAGLLLSALLLRGRRRPARA